MAEISGMAHLQLSVSDMTRSKAFYEPLLHSMGMITLLDDPNYFYCIGGKTGLAISPADPALAGDGFEQRRPGLHHLCFRAKSREDVEELYETALGLGATVVREPEESGFAPGYYSTLFEDPDGIRIEVNFVPGKGHLQDK